MSRRVIVNAGLVAALLLGAAFAAIIGTAEAQDATPTSDDTFPVTITFLNAMTALDDVDIFINGDDKDQRVVEGLPYGEFSEAFEGTAPATNVIVKQNVNLGFDQWLFNTIIPTEAGKNYLVVISDFIIIPTLVDTSVTSDSGARFRFIHAAAQAPPVDVVFDGQVAVEELRYGQASDIGFAEAGTYDVTINQAGTDTVVIESTGVEAEAGKVYTAVVIGEPGSSEEPITAVVHVEELQSDA